MAGPARPLLSRRTFIGASAAMVAVGCNASSDQVTQGATTSTTRPGQGLPLTLVALFDAPGGIVVAGAEQRLTWAVGDEVGVLLPDQPARLPFEFELEGQRVARVEGVLRNAGVDQAFLTSTIVFPRPGLATASVMVDGVHAVAEINVVSADDSLVPGPGDPMPRVVTPTLDDPLGVRPLCSRVPACPFHDSSLADALAASRPVAFLVAAPGYCESTSCPPALDLLIDAANGAPHVTIVHTEVYVDPEEANSLMVAERTDAVHRYGLTFEPSLFLASPGGTVVERLDNVFDADELMSALSALD